MNLIKPDVFKDEDEILNVNESFYFYSKHNCYKIHGFRFIGKPSNKIELPNKGNIFIVKNLSRISADSFAIFEINPIDDKVYRMFKLSQIEEVIFEDIKNKKEEKE